MNDDRDPDIQALFAAVERDLPGEDFTAAVTARLTRRQRLHRLVGAGLVLLVMAIAGLLTGPAVELALWLAGAMTQPLVSLSADGAATLLAPLNSVGFVLAMTLLLLWRGWRFVSS